MIEKILERLETEADKSYHAYTVGFNPDDRAEYDAYIHATEIVQEVAKDGWWIPCSERLPEAHKNVLVCEKRWRNPFVQIQCQYEKIFL